MRMDVHSQLNKVLSQAIIEILDHAEQAIPAERREMIFEAQEIDRLRIRLLRQPEHGNSQDYNFIPATHH